MKSLVLCTVVFGIACASSAYGQSISGSSFRNGYRYNYEINDDTLKNTPSWDPEKGEPPVSFRRAMEIGWTNLGKEVPKPHDRWHLSKLTLHRIGWSENKWIYEAEFQCLALKDELCDDPSSFDFWIKLDGTVIEPTRVPDNEPANMKTGPTIKVVPRPKSSTPRKK